MGVLGGLGAAGGLHPGERCGLQWPELPLRGLGAASAGRHKCVRGGRYLASSGEERQDATLPSFQASGEWLQRDCTVISGKVHVQSVSDSLICKVDMMLLDKPHQIAKIQPLSF